MVSSSVATRDLLRDAELGMIERAHGAYAPRSPEKSQRGVEQWIFVVKLLRAHGGCLGVRRR